MVREILMGNSCCLLLPQPLGSTVPSEHETIRGQPGPTMSYFLHTPTSRALGAFPSGSGLCHGFSEGMLLGWKWAGGVGVEVAGILGS